MYCPVCVEVQLVLAERQGIEIDYCPKCRGVWLDRGELDKLIERTATMMPPAASTGSTQYLQPRHDEYDEHYDHRRRKKHRGFLDDIFDFD